MGYLHTPIKNWGQRNGHYVAVEVREPAGFIGKFVTLPSGDEVLRNGRTIYADKLGTVEPLPVIRASRYGSY